MSTTAKKPPVEERRIPEAHPAGDVYVFELPVRLAHWLLFFSIAALSVTGWWIGTGDMPMTPFGRLQMQQARFAHVVAGWVMVAAIVMRVIWFFTGNAYASWREWIPTTPERRREIPRVIKFYSLLWPRAPYPEHGAGHNVIAGLTYCAVFTLLSFMAISGIALERTGAPGDWHAWVAWPIAWLEPQTIRLLHHIGMWLIWGFVVHHMASATLVDAETRGRLFGAIFSGWRPHAEPPKETKT